MAEDFDDIRGLLVEAAGEIPALAPAPERTIRRARRRAASTVTLGALGVIAAIAIAIVLPTQMLDDRAVPADDRGGVAVEGVVRTGERPSSVAVADGALWVANTNEANIVRIDPETLAIEERIDLAVTGGCCPENLQYLQVSAGEGAVWVLSTLDGRLIRVDPTTDTVTGRVEIAGATSLSAGAGAVWVTRVDGVVARIDPVTGDLVAEIATGPRPVGVATTEDAVWVADDFAGTISRIDPSSDTVVARIRTGANLAGFVTADERGAWAVGCVPSDGSRDPRVDPSACGWAMLSVDALSGTLSEPVLLPPQSAADRIGEVPFEAVAIGGGAVWGVPAYTLCSTVCMEDAVLRFEPLTGEASLIPLGEGRTLIDVVYVGDELWVLTKDTGELIRIRLLA